MKMERFSITSADGRTALAAYRLIPAQPRAMLQISHGMCEYFLRYEGFAEYLAARGILVFGHDHLGHGSTATSEQELGFTVKGGGARVLAEDVHNLSLKMKKKYPELPLILLGHSMGSFIARSVAEKYPSTYRAVIFSGTGGPDIPANLGRWLAGLMMLFCTERHRSKLMRSISFAGYNKKFEKGCDRNAWLTRDAAVVEAYNADPHCGFVFTLRGYYDMFTHIAHVSRVEWAEHMKKDLPILLFSGEMDPVGSWGKGVRRVAERLEKAGAQDVTLKLYPEMRHETLNEIGKEQVWSDIAEWIDLKLR